MRVAVLVLIGLLCGAGVVHGEVAEVYDFGSRAEEERFQSLISELRCPKCQNQNIADSNSPISKDMREAVYRMMQQGASNDDIVGALVDRFGEFVQYKPPVDQRTILLWAFPAIAVGGGFLIVVGVVWRARRRGDTDATLNDEDRQRAAQILSARDEPADR
ncbi:MAG: cytochrome c-type biogenesis protein CcmH [Marinobacter sp. 34-60-7]|nr:MAG: cytochrome c-type biogenesis protein CcmH [Marinobacter sp. 34-60-7]